MRIAFPCEPRPDFNILSWHQTRNDVANNVPRASSNLSHAQREMNTTRGTTPGLVVPEGDASDPKTIRRRMMVSRLSSSTTKRLIPQAYQSGKQVSAPASCPKRQSLGTVCCKSKPTDSVPVHQPGPDTIVGLEARGFLFGPSLALRLGAGFVPIRKKKESFLARPRRLRMRKSTERISSRYNQTPLLRVKVCSW